MKRLHIEWKHYAKDCQTCIRCSSTGKTLTEVIGELQKRLESQGVQVTFSEVILPKEELADSNIILFNGIAIEDLLSGAEVSESPCDSCSCLAGSEVACRTVDYEGQTFEEIPEELIFKAANAALHRIAQ